LDEIKKVFEKLNLKKNVISATGSDFTNSNNSAIEKLSKNNNNTPKSYDNSQKLLYKSYK
jgi:hypothetical protein